MKNQCNFIGRLGGDPEVRTMGSGKPVVNFSLAVSEKWRDKETGERKEQATWVPIVIFSEGLCKVAQNYLKKGSLVDITGAFKTRKWQDQSGNDKYTTEIVLNGFGGSLVMLDSRNDSEGGGYGQGSSQGGSQGQSQSSQYDTAQKYANGLDGVVQGGSNAMASGMDDEIPFFAEWR